MTDEHHGQPVLVLQICQKIERDRLNRHVESAHRLIGNEDVRTWSQRTGYGDSLPLAPGEFMRIATDGVDGELNRVDELGHPGMMIPLDLQGAKRLGDDSADLQPGVERTHRILEDHLYLPAERLHFRCLGDVDPVDDDFAPGGYVESDHQTGEGGLPGAGFPDDPEGLTLFDFEGDLVHRGDRPSLVEESRAWKREDPGDVLHRDDRLRGSPLLPWLDGDRGRPTQRRNGANQGPGVLVDRVGEDDPSLSLFHESARVHDHHLPGRPSHDGQVVGDDQQGRVEFLHLLVEDVQDLGLDGHVQGCRRLVGDDQIGSARQGHGDHRPLSHASRQLVRKGTGPQVGLFDPHSGEQIHNLLGGILT